jgi:hypothetical protein
MFLKQNACSLIRRSYACRTVDLFYLAEIVPFNL